MQSKMSDERGGGTAISSISVQTSFAIGAVLNATFGSIIEIIMYIIALINGLNHVVQNAITGCLLSNMLLIPGISMFFGGFKYREQYFNQRAAGVSSVMLFISVLGVFSPSLFYQIYGSYELDCRSCTPNATSAAPLECTGCQYIEKDLYTDDVYLNHARPLMYLCSAILPIAYIIGLIFTHKTHSWIYTQKLKNAENQPVEEASHDEGHVAIWSIPKCVLVLLVATGVYTLIAEVITSSLEPAIEKIGLSNDFAGLTLLAVVPNTAELINAIQFAIKNNISLSMEIGSVSAIQICLLQLPVLVLISAIFFHTPTTEFTLMFPRMNLFIIMFSVLLLNYLTIHGRSNYFDGSALLIVYLLIVAAFFFVPLSASQDV